MSRVRSAASFAVGSALIALPFYLLNSLTVSVQDVFIYAFTFFTCFNFAGATAVVP